jgi:hypothetical protein
MKREQEQLEQACIEADEPKEDKEASPEPQVNESLKRKRSPEPTSPNKLQKRSPSPSSDSAQSEPEERSPSVEVTILPLHNKITKEVATEKAGFRSPHKVASPTQDTKRRSTTPVHVKRGTYSPREEERPQVPSTVLPSPRLETFEQVAPSPRAAPQRVFQSTRSAPLQTYRISSPRSSLPVVAPPSPPHPSVPVIPLHIPQFNSASYGDSQSPLPSLTQTSRPSEEFALPPTMDILAAPLQTKVEDFGNCRLPSFSSLLHNSSSTATNLPEKRSHPSCGFSLPTLRANPTLRAPVPSHAYRFDSGIRHLQF